MRLIDADALKRAIETKMPSRVEVNLIVDEQPTAQNAIVLLTERTKPHKDRGWWVCECKAAISVDVDGEPLHKCKFCSECGRAVNWDDLPV